MSNFEQFRRWACDAWIMCPVVLIAILILGNVAHCQEPQTVLTDEATEQSVISSDDQHHGKVGAFLPQLPDAVTQLPVWAGQAMPFDVDEYFTVTPTAKRAATKYLDAFLEFSYDMESCFVEDRHAHTWVVKPEYATRVAVTKVRWLWAVWVLERFEDDPDSVDPEEIDDLLREFEEGFRKLREAQQLPTCVFQIAIDPLAVTPHAGAAKHVFWVVRLRVHRHLASADLDAALDDIEMLLRLARDLRPRGNDICQRVSLILQQLCWEDLLPQIIAHEDLEVEHCDRMLKLIAPHDKEVDPILESERYEQLMWRRLIYQLEHNEYDVAARVEKFGLDGSFIVPTMLLWNCVIP